jgi:hypothetical protein
MTDTTIGSWCGRTLRVIHAPGTRARWRMEVTPRTRHTIAVFRAWLAETWPALMEFHYSLELPDAPRLMAAVARLIHACADGASADANRATRWLRELETVEPAMRLQFLEAVIPHAGIEPPLELLRLARPGANYRDELTAMLEPLSRGFSAELVRNTTLYAQLTSAQIDWDQARPGSTFDAGRALELLTQADATLNPHLCGRLWESMVGRKDAARLYAAGYWHALDAPSAERFLRFFVYELSDSRKSPAALDRKLWSIRRHYLSLSAEEQAQARDLTNTYLHHLPAFWPVVKRLPHPLPEDIYYHHVLGAYDELSDGPRQLFASAPAKSFDTFIKALKRRNERELVCTGMNTLCIALPQPTAEAFCVAPKHLMHLARFVGALHEKYGIAILRQVSRHELCTAHIADGDIVALDNLLARHRTYAQRLPRFHEWDLHFSGRKLMPLSGVQLAFAELRSQIALMAVWHAENAVKAHLAFDPHTYAMLRESEKNRRLLHRFLRKPHLNFIDSHPATIAWRERHAGFDVDRWRRGVPFHRDGIRLTIERDYREILKMGTYVGSCLGLGGHNQFNAATALLDINKQVVFARDAQGKFAARQLLAISAEGRLVCFPVYSATGERAQWEPLFADYARALAWTLGLTIRTSEKYEIPRVIARDWYDDGRWDLVADEDRVAA